MKSFRSLMLVCLTCCLTGLLWSSLPAADAAGNTITIPADNIDKDSLRKAVDQAEDGDVIVIEKTGQVNSVSYDNNVTSVADPWVIDKAVTIQGGELRFGACGIVLGADVTLKDICLNVGDPVRNSIMANGYTLTLENVTANTSASQQMHLFCGSPTTGGFTSNLQVPQPGPLGRIIIKGSTSLGNIYAGGISTDGENTTSTIPASIVVDASATGTMGELYACGALETWVDQNEMFDYASNGKKVAPPTPSTLRYPVTAPVTVELYGNAIRSVHGATGGSEDARVSFSAGTTNEVSLSLEELAALSVQSGTLHPTALSGDGMELSIASDAALRLWRTPSLPQVGTLTGPGRLVLGQTQTLTVLDGVSGPVTLLVGGENYEGNSTVFLLKNHCYLSTPEDTSSEALSFRPADGETLELTCVSGKWVALQTGEEIQALVSSLSPPTAVVSTVQYVEVPLEPVFAENGAEEQYLEALPLELRVNGEDAVRVDGYYGYEYTALNGELLLYAANGYLCIDGNGGGLLPYGVYEITLTVPADCSADGERFQAHVTVVVQEAYGLGPITLRTEEGEELTGLASGSLLAEVTVTGEEEVVVLLAAYNDQGQMAALLPPVTAHLSPAQPLERLTFPVENSAGQLIRLKAFALKALDTAIPGAPAVSFPQP